MLFRLFLIGGCCVAFGFLTGWVVAESWGRLSSKLPVDWVGGVSSPLTPAGSSLGFRTRGRHPRRTLHSLVCTKECSSSLPGGTLIPQVLHRPHWGSFRSWSCRSRRCPLTCARPSCPSGTPHAAQSSGVGSRVLGRSAEWRRVWWRCREDLDVSSSPQVAHFNRSLSAAWAVAWWRSSAALVVYDLSHRRHCSRRLTCTDIKCLLRLEVLSKLRRHSLHSMATRCWQ